MNLHTHICPNLLYTWDMYPSFLLYPRYFNSLHSHHDRDVAKRKHPRYKPPNSHYIVLARMVFISINHSIAFALALYGNDNVYSVTTSSTPKGVRVAHLVACPIVQPGKHHIVCSAAEIDEHRPEQMLDRVLTWLCSEVKSQPHLL
jgi:hypothetical protein